MASVGIVCPTEGISKSEAFIQYNLYLSVMIHFLLSVDGLSKACARFITSLSVDVPSLPSPVIRMGTTKQRIKLLGGSLREVVSDDCIGAPSLLLFAILPLVHHQYVSWSIRPLFVRPVGLRQIRMDSDSFEMTSVKP